MPARKSSDKRAPSLTPALLTLHRQLWMHLHPVIERLRLAQSVVVTAALALRQQNADGDHDVAAILRRYAADPLDAEIERLETLLKALRGGAPEEPSSGETTH